EISLPVPSLNDDAVHYLLIQRASEALARGENILDHWLPQLELGFPFFFYYQHLPHLFVVALHRVLFQQFDLLTLFNVVRYLLLVGFPLTVYWSMRRLEFSVAASASGAAAASLLSSNHRYGFEYDSYVWRGLGVYTQLWAMHLYFIVLAQLRRVIERGAGVFTAVLACSALGLAHLLYSYMLAISAVVLFLYGIDRANWRARVARLALVGGLTLAVCSYIWVPYAAHSAYFGWSPYLQKWKYDSFGAGEVLTWLANGDLFDYGRLPALTVLLALGIAAALHQRSRHARLALALFSVWLLLYFGRTTWGRLMDVLPLHDGLLLHRFVGSLDVAAILLIGLGGEWLFNNLELLMLNSRFKFQNSKFNIHSLVAVALLLIFLLPALRERRDFYSLNRQWIERTRRALADDEDGRSILATLKELPSGRVYAGLRANWGKELAFGDVHFYDLLTFNRLPALSPPYSDMSLNADLIWHFDDRNIAHYDLFDVKYVIAPRRWPPAEFLTALKQTPRYTLYRAEASGYADFVEITARRSPVSQAALFYQNLDWFKGSGPAEKRVLRYDYPVRAPGAPVENRPRCRDGKIVERSVAPGRIEFDAACPAAADIAIKMTYHPNWRVLVDGRETPTFMLSPSFVGFELPAGGHRVVAEYRGSPLKLPLLVFGAVTLAAVFVFRRRLEGVNLLTAK
ncbi:MAG TPA: hypothetical protein VHL99_06750, partial [Candidatus Binatia bacterium]|nr:hypothetical protein [Candidatus Binatia bacterium]